MPKTEIQTQEKHIYIIYRTDTEGDLFTYPDTYTDKDSDTNIYTKPETALDTKTGANSGPD